MGQPHGLESSFRASPPAPALPGDVVVRETLEELLDEVAEDVATQASNCVRAFGDFHLALSGARAVRRLVMRLMIDPSFRELPWKYTHVWVTSDLEVQETDDRSTIGMVQGLLGDHAGIPSAQIHAMSPHLPDGPNRYEDDLKQTLAWREKGHDRLDCVVLGVDASGSIEGLAASASSSDGLVVRDETGGIRGLSMTAGLVRASRLISVLGIGEHGAPMHEMAKSELPGSIAPLSGVLRWYLDHAACASEVKDGG